MMVIKSIGKNSQTIRQQTKNIFKFVLLIAAISLLTVGCSSLQKESTLTVPDTSNTSHIISITPQAGDTAESLAKEYGGEILAFEQGELALIGLSIPQNDTFSTQLLSHLSISQGDIEENDTSYELSGETGIDSASSSLWAGGSSSLWAGGSSILWAGGSSSLWAGGSSSLWAGGSFDWMPENTDIWKQIGLDAGHSQSQNLGAGTIVAVIDTGVDYTHPALANAIMPGWDFYDNDDDPFDEGVMFENRGTGHGTHIAGIVRQVAPRATILPIRVLGPDGTGTIADLAMAILWAEEQGADVINLSLGSTKKSKTLEKVIKKLEKKGIVIVASVGNSDDKNLTYPAKKFNVDKHQISVTSVDRNDEKSSFSNHDKDVAIAAPGEGVYGPAPGGLKVAWSGTSMAAPMVAGAIALAKGETDSLSKDGKKWLAWYIRDSAHDIYKNNNNKQFKDKVGKGRLDIGEFFKEILED